MIDYNGTLFEDSQLKISIQNSLFQSGYGFKETLKIQGQKPLFVEQHYLKIMSKMRMLRMPIPMTFTPDFFESILSNLVENSQEILNGYLDVFIFETQEKESKISYIIESHSLVNPFSKEISLELFNDYYWMEGRHQFVSINYQRLERLASLYAKENGVTGCLFLNNNKQLVDSTLGTLFFIEGNNVSTPSLNSGARDTVLRANMISWIQNQKEFQLIEVESSPFALQKVEAVFTISNDFGFQKINQYRKKSYNTDLCAPFESLYEKGLSGLI